MLSLLIHVLHNRLFASGQPLTMHVDTRRALERFDAAHRVARQFARRHPEASMLEIDVCAGEGWERLCPFLGLPTPGAAFPWENQSSQKLKQAWEGIRSRVRHRAPHRRPSSH